MTAIEKARAFISACERKDWDTIRASLHPAVVYHNIPMPVVKGVDASIAVLKQFMDDALHISFEIIAIAEDSQGRVLHERLDKFTLPGGKQISLPVCGVFDYDGDKIIGWRDYFDLGDFQRQMAG
jgi:limonene-1,2-epoxide hydrolase